MSKYIGNQPAEKYTINTVEPDINGNFTITANDLNVAAPEHDHMMDEVVGLQTQLDEKAHIDHLHDYVQGIGIDGEVGVAIGTVKFAGTGDMTIQQNADQITFTQNAATQAVATSLTDAVDNLTEIKTFIGTQAEWDAFTPGTGLKYIVYIHA